MRNYVDAAPLEYCVGITVIVIVLHIAWKLRARRSGTRT